LADAGLAIRAPLHAAVVRDEGLPAPAGHNPVFRDLLGLAGPAPGIDRGAGGIESAAVADDQGLPLVFDATADRRRHVITLRGRDVNGIIKSLFYHDLAPYLEFNLVLVTHWLRGNSQAKYALIRNKNYVIRFMFLSRLSGVRNIVPSARLTRAYCSPACRQAAYRQRRTVDNLC
jgi:hypothetical protein